MDKIRLEGTKGSRRLSDFQGKKLVLFVYPKDNTTQCTFENIDFSNALEEFEKLNTHVVGVSRDSLRKHRNFSEKHGLKVELLSDEEKKLHEALGVLVPKKIAGREGIGVSRSTFIFDEEGKLIRELRGIRVKDHVQEVLEWIKNYGA